MIRALDYYYKGPRFGTRLWLALIHLCCNHRETSRDALLEFIVSAENWSACLRFSVSKNNITKSYTKKYDQLLVNDDKKVN